MSNIATLLALFVFMGLTLARPKDSDPAKKRVHEEDVLSDIEHGIGEDENAEHNPDYDHEAFLGKEEAKTFDQLTPEESKERLRELVEKIDKDNNGEVSEEELHKWIDYTQKRYIYEDVDRQWKQHKTVRGDQMTWEEYVNATYGQSEKDLEARTDYDYKSLLVRDKRRWGYADVNKDGALTREEYANYLHPEEVEHMKEVVVLETLEDIDKNKDGYLTLEEYIGDMYPSEDRENGEEEPEWVKTEREQFGEYRDKNKDGKMDKSEVRDWIMPENYDHIEAETKHLMYEADVDKSGALTMQEILDKYDLFVGSQATDFGEALVRSHDEF